jgi:hypothetical protein
VDAGIIRQREAVPPRKWQDWPAARRRVMLAACLTIKDTFDASGANAGRGCHGLGELRGLVRRSGQTG